MSSRLVSFHEWTCNRCKKVLLTDGGSMPKGWQERVVDVHDCGLTGYTKQITQHYCNACPADV